MDSGGGSEEEGLSQLVADLKGHNVDEASVGWAIPWYIIKCGRYNASQIARAETRGQFHMQIHDNNSLCKSKLVI